MDSGGGSSGLSAGKGGGALSSEAKQHYDIEMSDATNFAASFVLDKNTTDEAIGYQMYVHKDVTGRSLIADTQNDADALRRDLKNADVDGRSYGMAPEAIKGMKQGLREKISMRETAIERMTRARPAYEKFVKESSIGNSKSKKRKGKWM